MASYHGMEPIAIVGIGCRFADNASSPSKLWEMLKEGRSGQSDVPKNRFNVDSWYSNLKGRPGSLYSKGGYFLSHDDNYREFDPSFFGISPLEATSMDPQQRKLLEVVYECFESAGKSLDDVSGSDIACYVGCFSHDHGDIQSKDPEYGLPYQSTGASLTILSNRVNYVFNLRGPSLTVDTACSSSLYALHLACQSLITGECSGAVVGGSSIIASIEKHMGSGRLGILSPTSTCHTFDASADGFGRGDGIAAIYIKRLSTAIQDGDPIRAVIRATAINSNGTGQGINHPGAEMQEAVIRRAYSKANLSFKQTGYFECHGTGTKVGDPIECAAVGRVFAEGRSLEEPLIIGSVKTNLGHCEGASGLASVIKSVLCLEHALIAPTVGIKQLNPDIDFKDGRLKVARDLIPWPAWQPYRRASANGFGFGGANAHVILDATESFLYDCYSVSPFTHRLSPRESARWDSDVKYLLTLSAHDMPTLNKNMEAIISTANDYTLPDVAFTLASRHSTRLSCRTFLTHSRKSLQEGTLTIPTISYTRNKITEIAFIFTGQGAQWPQMGYKLFERFELFRQVIRKLQQYLQELPTPPDFSIERVLSEPKGTSSIYHSIRSPVCCTAVQVALVTLLMSWGVKPAAVVGHSAGEIAAAFAAGLITGGEAVSIAYYRGLAVLKCKEDGAMLAVGLGADDVQQYICNQPGVVIGCYNSPQSVTLSGESKAIDNIRETLVGAGIFARKVNSSGNAYHSPLMHSAAVEFRALFEDIYTRIVQSPTRGHRLARVSMFSAVTNELLQVEEISYSHWQKNLENPTYFDQATQLLINSLPTIDTLIEIGPHSALSGPIRQISAKLKVDQSRLGYLPSLIRFNDSVEDMLNLAGSLFTMQYPIDINIANFGLKEDAKAVGANYHSAKILVDLAGYQWNYDELLWKENRLTRDLRFRKHYRHDLLGSREPGSSQIAPLYRNKLKLSDVPWLRDHMIGGNVVLPAAGYIALAIEATTRELEILDSQWSAVGYEIQDLKISSALIIPEESFIELCFNLYRTSALDGSALQYVFSISSVTQGGKWSEHANGKISLAIANPPERTRLQVKFGLKKHNVQAWYAGLSAAGISFGPCFQTLSKVATFKNEEKKYATATIDLCTTKGTMTEESRYIIHPTALDGCLQLSVVAAFEGTKLASKPFLPVSINKLSVWSSSSRVVAEDVTIMASGKPFGLRSLCGTAKVFGVDGSLMMSGEMTFMSLEGDLQHQHTSLLRKPYTSLVWKPDVDRLKAANFEDHAITLTGFQGSPLIRYMELVVHKGRPIDVLLIGKYSDLMVDVLETLGGGNGNPIYKSCTVAIAGEVVDELQKTSPYHHVRFTQFDLDSLSNNAYDVIILSDLPKTIKLDAELLLQCRTSLRKSGRLLIDESASQTCPESHLRHSALETGLELTIVKCPSSQLIVLEATNFSSVDDSPHSFNTPWLVYYKNMHPIHEQLIRTAKHVGVHAKSIALSDVSKNVHLGSTAIITAELEQPLLENLTADTLAALQHITKVASSVVWVTNCGVLSGEFPEKSLALGIAKTLTTEQPSLQLCCFDVDPSQPNYTRSASNIAKCWESILRAEETMEKSLAEKDGVVYVSRLVLDDVKNATFEKSLNHPIELQALAGDMELDFTRVGQVESFYFKPKPDEENQRQLNIHELCVEPSAYSVSHMEACILKGQRVSEFFSHECVAVIKDVGSGIQKFSPGDTILCFAPRKFDTSFITDQSLCYRLPLDEEPERLIGTILPMCIALSTFDYVGRMKPQDAVLIHLPEDIETALAFGILARYKTTKVFITYSGDLQRDYLMQAKVSEDDLIPASSAHSMISMTKEYELKAVITAPSGHPQELCRFIKTSGACILLGTDSEMHAVDLFNQSIFSGRISIVPLITTEIFENKTTEYLVSQALEVYSWNGKSHVNDPISFDVARFGEAISRAMHPEALRKTIITYNGASRVPTLIVPPATVFDAGASYLMVGCLGGLGRSLVKWMADRGARNFLFLSRSGGAKSETQALIQHLHGLPGKVSCQISHGDVSLRGDVDRAVKSATTPIKGVIQAAAAFRADLFKDMTPATFNEVLAPKIRGTLNIHEALIDVPLDFFVMTSSTLGIKGSATQSHYAAGNAYMDSMARHRWAMNLQATSLALGLVKEVGHVHETPGMEKALIQNGLYGISEDEYLLMMENAMRPRDLSTLCSSSKWDPYAGAHVITGFEPGKINFQPFQEKRTLGRDERFNCLLLSSLDARPDPDISLKQSKTTSILTAAKEAGGLEAMEDAVREVMLVYFGKLMLVSVEKLREGLSRPLTDYGMDSMVSSEIRAIAWNEFAVDIHFMQILEKGLRLGELIDMIWEKMEK
ncbi:hypothetical protein BJ878DRAFT_509631 [Calycina marina]|uniref:Polyketide synthase n=1 Tax=Calycina marina TaxID=1763456 RepID=A0A9P7Z2I3_9HELO|nr:hypothetical protein BJ878DRAFT_509631 [Calycina marina]